jgi:hypothetical protein
MLKKILITAYFAFLIFNLGCAPGIEYRKFWDSSNNISVPQPLNDVIIGIQDVRPYVLDGEKKESFVGRGLETMMTGVLPVYTDLYTFSRKPLADDFSILIENNLANTISNLKVVKISSDLEFNEATKELTKNTYKNYFFIRLKDFQFESGYANSKFIYNIYFDTIDSSGNVLKSLNQEGSEDFSGIIPGPGRIQLDLKVVDIFDNFFSSIDLNTQNHSYESKEEGMAIDSPSDVSSKNVIDSKIETTPFNYIPDTIKQKIREKCANDFPDDFILQVECVDSQTEAWTVLQE